MAGLTMVYVVLAFLQDESRKGVLLPAVLVLAGVFLLEFSARLYDSASRLQYLRGHWLDLVTCIPVAGTFRALRLLRLLAFFRLGRSARQLAMGHKESVAGSSAWILAPMLLIVWIAASYGYYELEGGVNPHIQSFADALYFSFITASTVGYGDVTPVTPEGKVLTGILIFVGLGLLGFASSQLTAKMLFQKDEVSELKRAVERQSHLLEQLIKKIEAERSIESAASDAELAEQFELLESSTTPT